MTIKRHKVKRDVNFTPLLGIYTDIVAKIWEIKPLTYHTLKKTFCLLNYKVPKFHKNLSQV